VRATPLQWRNKEASSRRKECTMKRVVALASALAVCVGCRDQHSITSPSRPSWDFSDGTVSGGNPHFFFLPPLVRQPSFSGTFNPALRPVVEICQLDVDITNSPIACNATVPIINPGVVQLDLLNQLYQVNWNTLLPPIDPTKVYRVQIRVAPGGTILGFADVDPVLNGSELKNVDTGELIGLVDGRTLPIKFRIEIGVACQTTDCFEGTVGTAGGTFITSSGLAGTFFPPGALSNDVFLVIDRVDARPCVPIDVPQFPGCYRFSTDPRPGRFNVDVIVGICADNPTGLSHAQQDLAQIFQFDPGSVVALPNVPATFLACPSAPLIGARLPPGLRQLVRYFASLLVPSELRAEHLGVGGSSGSYSIFGWGLPTQLSINAGNGQTAVSGTAVPIPPSVLLQAPAGTGIAGEAVTFTVGAGTGSITGADPPPVSDANGIATVGSWTLGDGSNTLFAASRGAVGSPQMFTATGVTISAAVMDAVGDATADPRVLVTPDLVSATAMAGGGSLALSVRFAPGTFDATAAHVFFNLDTDQNPATGFPGVDAAHNDAALLGSDYLVVMGSNAESGTAKVLRWDAASSAFMLVTTEPVTVGLAGYDVTVPLAVLGNDDGQMNFKVVVQSQLPGLQVGYTGVQDYLPDIGAAPGTLTLPAR